MKKPIRIGVLGLGQIALTAHLPGFDKTPHCQITALSTQREARGRKLAAQYGASAVFNDWRRLVRSPLVDAVTICLPNHLHAPATLAALRAGKHVLVEKPMALNLVEAAQMIQEAAKSHRVLMVHHNMRFDPALRCAGKLLRRGVAGPIHSFKCSLTHRGPERWSPQANWFRDHRRSGGGVLMDLGVHVFDSLRYLLRDEVKSVVALTPRGMGRIEEHAVVMLEFRKGTVGTVHLSWKDTHYQNRYYLFCEKGALSVNLGKGDPVAVEARSQEGLHYPDLTPDCFKPALYEHFLDCVRTGKTPETSGAVGAAALAVAEGAYASVRSRRWETIRPPKAQA